MFDDIEEIARRAKHSDRSVQEIQHEMAELNEEIDWDRAEFNPDSTRRSESDVSVATADD